MKNAECPWMANAGAIVDRGRAEVCGVASGAWAYLLLPAWPMAQVPNVPAVDASNQTDLQSSTHFLTFIGSHVPGNVYSSLRHGKRTQRRANSRRRF